MEADDVPPLEDMAEHLAIRCKAEQVHPKVSKLPSSSPPVQATLPSAAIPSERHAFGGLKKGFLTQSSLATAKLPSPAARKEKPAVVEMPFITVDRVVPGPKVGAGQLPEVQAKLDEAQAFLQQNSMCQFLCLSLLSLVGIPLSFALLLALHLLQNQN